MPRKRRARGSKPVRPNTGIEVAYRRRLINLATQMADQVSHWAAKLYAANAPKIVGDAPPPLVGAEYHGGPLPWQAVVNGQPLTTNKDKIRWFKTEYAARAAATIAVGQALPAELLNAAMSDLGDKWVARFEAAAPRMAAHFAKAVGDRSDAALKGILRDSGISVRFQMTPAMVDVMHATTAANVSLITSIPEQYMKGVTGAVMRSVQTGRDLGSLTKELTEQFGVTKRRAAFIALDQNNKATSAMNKARELEMGIERGIWMHSHGGKTPRPKHVEADGVEFDLRKGLKVGDKGQWVMPGEEIGCRCVWRVLIPGMSK